MRNRDSPSSNSLWLWSSSAFWPPSWDRNSSRNWKRQAGCGKGTDRTFGPGPRSIPSRHGKISDDPGGASSTLGKPGRHRRLGRTLSQEKRTKRSLGQTLPVRVSGNPRRIRHSVLWKGRVSGRRRGGQGYCQLGLGLGSSKHLRETPGFLRPFWCRFLPPFLWLSPMPVNPIRASRPAAFSGRPLPPPL